ncbi:spore cortex-lytic enzyme [Calidifontibacillus oryziterrae]|uniref:spore cortex-lytic enzyme n=1 Tax=Calidifontibacillus oryziterrae TaxID=1191699 RepID=UPI0002D5EB7F|nr:spore cortex-lytic enzyme [Calidifontibacillus oryziterrae]
MRKHRFFIILTCILSFSLLFSTINVDQANASTTKVIKQGMNSGYVYDLQHRLQQTGTYKEAITGYFGPVTKNAVVKFQKRYGLTPDGIVGPNTWRALYKHTFTANEIEMLAKLVHGEARGETFEGKVAVAAVVLNRVDSKKFPNTVKSVIFEPYAFTAVADGQYYTKPNKVAYQAVYNAIQGWDPSYGALFYFNPKTATSKWIWSRPQIKQIDNHIFTL